MDDLTLPDFGGKIVVLYVSDPPRGVDMGVTLEYVEFRKWEGRLFLVGRMPEMSSENDWVARLQGGVAWDSVVHYLVFDSQEEFRRRMEMSRPTFLQRLFARRVV